MMTAAALFFGALAMNAFFSGSETGFFRLSRLRLVMEAVGGDRARCDARDDLARAQAEEHVDRFGDGEAVDAGTARRGPAYRPARPEPARSWSVAALVPGTRRRISGANKRPSELGRHTEVTV